jgi:hypothetical protein
LHLEKALEEVETALSYATTTRPRDKGASEGKKLAKVIMVRAA